jgi:hypothetical protein
MNLFQLINLDLPDTAWYYNNILYYINYGYIVHMVLKIIKSLLK